MCHRIEDGAIFVADSHFNKSKNELDKFLKILENGKIKSSQLFLMGDIFEFLAGDCRYFIEQNSKMITRINSISSSMEVFYFEGNHDYNLEKIFPNMKVISRENQPFFMEYKGEKIALAHGDIFTPKLYNIYCKIIRNRPLLKFLNFFDFNFFISKKIDVALNKKKICRNIENFENLAKRRVQNYDAHIVIEGHFHQGKEYILENTRYINIPSLFCQKEYVVFENGEFVKVELLTSKEEIKIEKI